MSIKRISITTGIASPGSYDPDTFSPPSFVAAVPNFIDGSDTPRAFLERCLEVVSEREPQVQAFAFINEEGARKAADAATKRYHEGRPLSPIDGCPIGFKDTLETADMPTQMNSRIYAGWRPNRDAACVHGLRMAGAVILAKTVVPEFAMGVSGPTRNPFDLRRTPGASSSGSGACVGAGMLPVAIGNQTGGSLIRPSSFNGIVGFKPTYGALNIGGMHPIAPSQDHIGPMAATLADAWLTAQQISATVGGHNGHPGLGGSPALPAPVKPKRLAWLHTLGWNELDEGSKAAFDRFLSDMRQLGVDIVDQSASTEIAALEKLLEFANEVSNDIIMYEGRWPIASYLEKYGDGSIGKVILDRIKRGTQMTRDDYCAALSKRNEIRRQVHTVAALVDGFVTLASSGPAPFDQIDEAQSRDRPQGHLETGSRSFLSPWSMVGGPSFSLPLLAVDSMPMGVQLMGVTDSDESLTGIAHWLNNQYDQRGQQ